MPDVLTVRTPTLEIAYESHGRADGVPVVLLHGFPDDARAFDGVAPPLAAAGCRVLVPYLRGYGGTRFLDAAEPRMAQQAAIGQDLLDFLDALGSASAGLSGYDWGGRAACIAAIVAPERVRALVTIGGYNVQNTLAPSAPASVAQERAYWYQWYFNTERGRAGLAKHRRELARLLWQEWSPTWKFDDATFERTAPSFDNPDFVPVVIHSYRHRHGNAAGDPRLDAIERRLAARAPITVPALILHGGDDPVSPLRAGKERAPFSAGTEERVVPGCGHLMPPNNRKPAMLPTTAEIIDNPIGTACGFAVDIGHARFFFTPGVPRELKRMLEEQIVPRLLAKSGLQTAIHLKRFHSYGLGESHVDALLTGLEDLVPDGSVKLGFRAHYPQLETKLTVRGKDMDDIRRKLEPVEREVRKRLGNFILSEDDATLEGVVLEELTRRRGSLSIVDMVTSDQIAAPIAHLPCAENVSRRGL